MAGVHLDRHDGGGQVAGEGDGPFGVDQPVGAGQKEERGHREPVAALRHEPHGGGDLAEQPRCDDIVDQRVFAVGGHRDRVTAQECGIDTRAEGRGGQHSPDEVAEHHLPARDR